MPVLGKLRALLATNPTGETPARVQALETHTRVLYERITDLERAEMVRAAEHAAMVDKLDRIYKRITARIAYAAQHPNEPASNGESPLALRNRLGR